MFATDPTGIVPPRSRPAALRPGRLTVPTGLLFVGALLIVWHLIIHSEGIQWASPLRLGDWLFNLAFALTLLTLAWAVGAVLARPLLGRWDDPLGYLLATLGIGVGVMSLVIFAAGLLHLLYSPLFLAAGIGLCGVLYRPGLAAGRAQFSDLRAWAARGRIRRSPRPGVS